MSILKIPYILIKNPIEHIPNKNVIGHFSVGSSIILHIILHIIPIKIPKAKDINEDFAFFFCSLPIILPRTPCFSASSRDRWGRRLCRTCPNPKPIFPPQLLLRLKLSHEGGLLRLTPHALLWWCCRQRPQPPCPWRIRQGELFGSSWVGDWRLEKIG